MLSTFLTDSLSTHHPYNPLLKRQPGTRTQYQVLYLNKTFTFKADVNGQVQPGLQECNGVFPLPRDGRIYPGMLQELRDGGCEVLISVDYERNNVPHLKKVLLSLLDNITAFRIHGVSPSKICVLLFCDGLKELLENFLASEDDFNFMKQFIDVEAISEKFNTQSVEKILCKELESETNVDPEIAHCFQTFVVTDESEFESLQLVCVVKQLTRRKLDSRLWFYKGFCELIRPKYCVILNAGIYPSNESIWRIFSAFQRRQEIGVVVGEVVPEKQDSTNIFQASLCLEMNVIQKVNRYFETTIGYPCTNCPFVAYRWAAIQGKPLYKGVTGLYDPAKQDPTSANTFGCGDCLLSLAAVTCKDRNSVYYYEKSATADTSVSSGLLAYVKQQKHITRTSIFLLIKSIKLLKKTSLAGENDIKKIAHMILIVYFSIKFTLMWLASGLTIAILCRPVSDALSSFGYGYAGQYVELAYCLMVLMAVLLTLGSQTLSQLPLYRVFFFWNMAQFILAVASFAYCRLFLNMYQAEFVLLCIWVVNYVFSAIATRACTLLPWNSLQYWALLPFQNNLVTTSCFCSLNNFYYSDWFSKTVAHRFTVSEDFQTYRTYIVLTWSFSNWLAWLIMRNGNKSLNVLSFSSSIIWYAVLGTIVGVDVVRLLVALPHITDKKLDTVNENQFYVAEPPREMDLESVSEEKVERDISPEKADLLESSGSQSDHMVKELNSSGELDLSICSEDLAGDFVPENLVSKNFSEISSVLKTHSGHFFSTNCSIKDFN